MYLCRLHFFIALNQQPLSVVYCCSARQHVASPLQTATASFCFHILLLQVIEQMGNWALRGVMFNMCMPVTAGSSARHTLLSSRSDTPEAAAAAMHDGAAPCSSSSSKAGRHSASSVLDAAGGCAGSDVAKRPALQDLGKLQTAGAPINGVPTPQDACSPTECVPSAC
jgi:hypothetical protein